MKNYNTIQTQKPVFQFPYRLGLDLGTNSIGWAILALNEDNKPNKIIDAGSRIFSSGREPETGIPLAVARREARGARRRRDRFLARKAKLMNYLTKIDLMPKDESERKKLEILNPYELRTKALDQALEPYKLGRAIFHLNQRRGFKSNRKEVAKEDEKSKSKTLNDQNLLKQRRAETNSRTLGEFFYKERVLKKKTTRAKDGEEGLYPTRDLYEKELNLIRESQSKYHPQITDKNWQEIQQIIFTQRPLADQEKGFCQLINQFQDLPDNWKNILKDYRNLELGNKIVKGLPRAYLALPSYQKFRILSEVNNLKIIDPNKDKTNLEPQEKQIIIDILSKQNSSAFSKLRKAISNKENNYDTDDFSFNLESERRKGLDGDKTSALLSKPEYFDKSWFSLELKKQDEIVEFILEAQQPEEIIEKAINEWGLSPTQAENLSKISFGLGVGNLCKEILRDLVTHMQQRYCRYDEATISLLGFSHSNSKTLEELEKQEVYGKLEYYGKVLQASTVSVKVDKNKKEKELNDEEKFGRIANPTVHIALNQIRKVINSIIAEYRNPSEIVIELARDLKLSKEEKERIEKAQRNNQTENDNIKKELKNFQGKGYNVNPENFDDRLKLKLWKELKKGNNDVALCPYSGEVINCTKLFSNEVEIEHILPFSKTFDDSFKNKTLSYRKTNQYKGDRSPYEAFGSSANGYNYQEIKDRAAKLPRNKSWRFYQDAMEKFNDANQFLASQLNDTRYLSKITKQYLAQICKANKISVSNGQLTSLLRHHWGLNSVLNKEKNIKTRNDHRHHAVDALVVAMTDRGVLSKVANAKKYYAKINNDNFEYVAGKFKIQKPWDNFREDVRKAVDKIIVSHKPDHGRDNKLHSQTYYGILKEKIFEEGSNKDPYNIITSKALVSLKKTEISKIRDRKIRSEIEDKTQHITKDKEDKKALLDTLHEYSKQSGIKRIRILDKTKTIIKISHPSHNPRFEKAISPDGNNHISVWKMPNAEIITDVVSNFRMNSIYEIKKGADGIDFVNKDKKFDDNQFYEKLKPHPAAKLLIRLFKNDLVKLEEKGEEKVVRIGMIGSNTQCKYFDNRIEQDSGTFYLNENSLKKKKICKIFVSPIGKVFGPGAILK